MRKSQQSNQSSSPITDHSSREQSEPSLSQSDLEYEKIKSFVKKSDKVKGEE